MFNSRVLPALYLLSLSFFATLANVLQTNFELFSLLAKTTEFHITFCTQFLCQLQIFIKFFFLFFLQKQQKLFGVTRISADSNKYVFTPLFMFATRLLWLSA